MHDTDFVVYLVRDREVKESRTHGSGAMVPLAWGTPAFILDPIALSALPRRKSYIRIRSERTKEQGRLTYIKLRTRDRVRTTVQGNTFRQACYSVLRDGIRCRKRSRSM